MRLKDKMTLECALYEISKQSIIMKPHYCEVNDDNDTIENYFDIYDYLNRYRRYIIYPIFQEVTYSYEVNKKSNEIIYSITMSNESNKLEFSLEEENFYRFKEYYDNVNETIRHLMGKIEKYHNKKLLKIAENFINLIDQNVFCNEEALLYAKDKYLDYHENDIDYIESRTKKCRIYDFDLECQLHEADSYIDDFRRIVESIIGIDCEEQSDFIDVLSWRIISEQLIKHYAEIWELYYQNVLGINYDEVGEREYIRQFYLNEKIETEKAKGVLIYYLLNKKKISSLKLYQEFYKYVELFDEIEKNKYIEDRKNLLMTKQPRKYVPHIIKEKLDKTKEEIEDLIKIDLNYREPTSVIKVIKIKADDCFEYNEEDNCLYIEEDDYFECNEEEDYLEYNEEDDCLVSYDFDEDEEE